MTLLTTFVTVAIAHFLARLSPGADFILVVNSALRQRKQTAASDNHFRVQAITTEG